MPYNELYTPSQLAPQQQIAVDSAGPLLPSDLQVQQALTGYAGTQRRGASDVVFEETWADNPHINDFGPLIKGARNPFDGPPSASRAKALMFSDDTTTVVQPNYGVPRIKKPDIRDFVPKMPWGVWVGTPEDVAEVKSLAMGAPGAMASACACVLPKSYPYSSVAAFMISPYNQEQLFGALKDAGVLKGIQNLLVWPPRIKPCLCSYVGRQLAAKFVDFAECMMLSPASKEIDLRATCDERNRAFARKLLIEMNNVQQKIQQWNYAKAAGRLRGLAVRSAYDRDAPALTRPVACLGASDLPQVFGPDFASNPDTYNAARTLSKPSTIFNADLKAATGIDYTKHKDWKDKEIPMR